MLRIQNEIVKLNGFNPFYSMDKAELDIVFLQFCTIFWLMYDKKMTKSTFFVELIENDDIRIFLKDICGFDDDTELYREILSRNPAICGSKMIKNRLKFAKKLRIMAK
jgi:hypothetical protein